MSFQNTLARNGAANHDSMDWTGALITEIKPQVRRDIDSEGRERGFTGVQVASIHPSGINSAGLTENNRWLISASSDGELRKFDFQSSLGGRVSTPANQRLPGLSDTVTKGLFLLSSWENKNVDSQRLFLARSLVWAEVDRALGSSFWAGFFHGHPVAGFVDVGGLSGWLDESIYFEAR